MVVKDVEREDIEHVCKSLGCSPIASLDHFTAEKLANAQVSNVLKLFLATRKFIECRFIDS
jgi:hypothetical protein